MELRQRLLGRLMTSGALGLVALVGTEGCHRNATANIIDGQAGVVDNNGPDPADANMAPVSDGSIQQTVYATQGGMTAPAARRTLAQSQPGTGVYMAEGQAAPIERRTPQDAGYGTAGAPIQSPDYDDQGYDERVDAGLDAIEEADQPPPPLPVYQQPEAPGPNYLWTPGYWGYASAGYYWVPGAWCAAPYPGALWTPGYWGYYGNRYRFHRGFWGLHIGFYGGVPYGFGYTGNGYYGGYWRGNNFFYNRSVNHIDEARITNVYNRTVIVNNVRDNRVSYNGGRGGIQARPGPAEMAVLREARMGPMSAQVQNRREAAGNRQQFFSQNQGRPARVAETRAFGADRGITAPQRSISGGQAGQGQLGGRSGEAGQGRPGQVRGFAGEVQGRPGQSGPDRQQVGVGGRPGQAQPPMQAGGDRPGQTQSPARPDQQGRRTWNANQAGAGQGYQGQQNQQARPNQGGDAGTYGGRLDHPSGPGQQDRPMNQSAPGQQARPNYRIAPGGQNAPGQQGEHPSDGAVPNQGTRPEYQGQQGRPSYGNAPSQQGRPEYQGRPNQGTRPGYQARPDQQLQTRPQVQQPQPLPQARPAPQGRTEPSAPQARPQQQMRPEQQARPTPQQGGGQERRGGGHDR